MAYAVLQGVQKGSFLVAARRRRKALLFEKGAGGAPVRVEISRIAFGAQVGSQSFIELVIFGTAEALQGPGPLGAEPD